MDNAIGALEKASTNFEQAEAELVALSPEKRQKLNGELALAERKLMSDAGLPRRPWVKHLLYAPGTYTGYGAKTVPGVREALEQSRFPEASEQLVVVTKAIGRRSSIRGANRERVSLLPANNMVCMRWLMLCAMTPALLAQAVSPALFNGLEWRMIGPFRAGRVVAVAGIPGDPTHFYFGAVGGGVWSTSDAGTVWKPLFDGQPVASIGALDVSVSDPNIIYAGTGESGHSL